MFSAHVTSPSDDQTCGMAPWAVGLTNQGATGYLNVVLQALFHIPAIREAVLALPLEGQPDPKKCPPLAWQRLYRGMSSHLGQGRSISTKEITQAMGWQAHHLNLGQDAHGMLYVLLLMLQHTCLVLDQYDIVQQLFIGTITDSSSFSLLNDHSATPAAAPSNQQRPPVAQQGAQQHYSNSSNNSSPTAAASSRSAEKPLRLPIQQIDQDQPFVTLSLPLYDTNKQQVTHSITGGLGLFLEPSTTVATFDSATFAGRPPASPFHSLVDIMDIFVETSREALQQQQQEQQPTENVQSADHADRAAEPQQLDNLTASVVHEDEQQQQQQSGSLPSQVCPNPQGPVRVLIITDSKISKPPPILVVQLHRSIWDEAHGRYLYLKHVVNFTEFLDVRWCCACSSSSSCVSTAAGSSLQHCCAGSQAVQLMHQEVTGQQHVPADRLYCLVNVVSLMSLPGSTLRRYCVFVRGATPADVEEQQQQQQDSEADGSAGQKQQQQQQQHGPRLQYSPGGSSWVRLYNEQVDIVPPEEALHQQYGVPSSSQAADTHSAAQHAGVDIGSSGANCWCDTSDGEEADSVASMLMYVRMDQWDHVMNSSSSISSNSHTQGLADHSSQQQAQHQQQQHQGHQDLSSYYKHLYHRGFYSGGDDHVDVLYQYMHELVADRIGA